MEAILGDTHGEAARGHFLMGVTALRFFGVVRHWKQMWINNTFRPVKRQGIEKWIFRNERAADSLRSAAPLNSQRKRKNDDVSLRELVRAYLFSMGSL